MFNHKEEVLNQFNVKCFSCSVFVFDQIKSFYLKWLLFKMIKSVLSLFD